MVRSSGSGPSVAARSVTRCSAWCEAPVLFWTAAAGGIGYRRCMDLDVPDATVGTEEEERLGWMRDEFRAAQHRRYEKAAVALVNRELAGKPSATDVEPLTIGPKRD